MVQSTMDHIVVFYWYVSTMGQISMNCINCCMQCNVLYNVLYKLLLSGPLFKEDAATIVVVAIITILNLNLPGIAYEKPL